MPNRDRPVGALTVDVAGGVALLTIAAPPMNLVNVALSRALSAAIDVAENDPDVRVVILTAAGDRMFSAGSDIVEFASMLSPGEAVEQKLRPQNEIFSRLAALRKPTIAALNGDALGGGLEIAVCCDLIVAEEQVRLGSPEITLGVFPSSGGTFRVARRIGPARAKEMQLLGLPIDAQVALAWGLVNRIAPTGQGVRVARELAAVLLTRPPQATASCKAVIDLSATLPEADLIERSLMESERAFTSAECREGVRAFFAKQAPDFVGATSASNP